MIRGNTLAVKPNRGWPIAIAFTGGWRTWRQTAFKYWRCNTLTNKIVAIKTCKKRWRFYQMVQILNAWWFWKINDNVIIGSFGRLNSRQCSWKLMLVPFKQKSGEASGKAQLMTKLEISRRKQTNKKIDVWKWTSDAQNVKINNTRNLHRRSYKEKSTETSGIRLPYEKIAWKEIRPLIKKWRASAAISINWQLKIIYGGLHRKDKSMTGWWIWDKWWTVLVFSLVMLLDRMEFR